jgi:hypothetical protein
VAPLVEARVCLCTPPVSRPLVESPARLSAHSTEQAEQLLKLGAQSLSNMVYAYAVMGCHPGAQLLSAIAEGVQWQLRDFSPQVCPPPLLRGPAPGP